MPTGAAKLSFVLTGFDIEGEFEELVAVRRELAAPLIGKRIKVAQVFEFATKLQEAYIRAGYILVRVVVSPQELSRKARAKLQVIDGFIERVDVSALPEAVRGRVSAVLAPLVGKHHLTQGELQRRLLIAGETPGLEQQSTLAAGTEVGGSILILTGRYRPVSANLYGDDAMPVTLGTWQVASLLALNNIFGAGEQVAVNATGYPDRDFFTRFPTRRFLGASLALPLGIEGLKLSVTATDGRTTPRVDPTVATQGLFDQLRTQLAFDAVKSRDFELTFSAHFDATEERINSLVFTPPISLSLDRVRVAREAVDGIWRNRETGTTISFGATVSQGLPIFGARTTAGATPLLPLSRQGADAVFMKADGRLEATQSLPGDFVAAINAFAQTAFNRPLLTSEQFNLAGVKMLSGFPAGTLPADSAWVVRGELQRPISAPLASLVPYLFGATGERIFHEPTILELGTVHASNVGGGLRLFLPRAADFFPGGLAFVEGSRRLSTDPTLEGWRVFAGAMLFY